MAAVRWTSLPEEAWTQVALFVPISDLGQFMAVCRTCHDVLGKNAHFWRLLMQQHLGLTYEDNENAEDPPNWTPTTNVKTKTVEERKIQRVKYECMLRAFCQYLPAVHWIPLREQGAPSRREGHGACVLQDRMVITGGFSEDTQVYVKDLRPVGNPTTARPWQALPAIHLGGEAPANVYGASLTALDDGQSALQFGGFQSGGYSDETNQIAILTLHESAYNSSSQGRRDYAQWTVRPTQLAIGEPNDAWDQFSGRAYHSATMLFGRFLFICGGMQSNQSVLDPMLLDTLTWTWLNYAELCTSASTATHEIPRPRHGHSMVFDMVRNRCVMFGGGDGRDLLRSGSDHHDVWALSLQGWNGAYETVEASLPWRWHKIFAQVEESHPEQLSAAETLVLGRCHVAHHVSRDMVVLLFGSRNPSTNGILAFNLKENAFHRPRVMGPLPAPRFTLASAYLPQWGCIMVHGGYSTQCMHEVDGMALLDLAPSLRRRFTMVNQDTHFRPFPLVTDVQVQAANNRGPLVRLLNLPEPSFLELAVMRALGVGVEQFRMPTNENEEEDDEDDDDDDDYEPSSEDDE